jgi:phosphohistidine phosphatase SixA
MRRLLRALTAFSCIALPPLFLGITASAMANDDLWPALQTGGKVVVMRHAPVERGAASGNPRVRDPSCESERNLSADGTQKAEEIGQRFRDHQIPVSAVFHSPFCRTAQTAHAVFRAGQPADYLSLLEILTPREAGEQTGKLERVIGSYAGEGNLVLVTHEPNISAISFELLNHLDFLVLEPKGGSEFEELGVVRFSDPD